MSEQVRGTDFNTGLRGVLFEARHFHRMGSAVWLYAWLVLRQTHQSGGLLGWVLGGAPVCYREIEEETGFNHRTLERWMHTLRRQGYIETDAEPGGMVIRITKAKKFAHPPRGIAERVRRVAEGGTQSGVAGQREVHSNHEGGGRIRSSSVVGIKERAETNDFHRDFHGPAQSDDNSTPRTKLQGPTANPSCLDQEKNRKPEPPSQPQLQPKPTSNAQQHYHFLQESRLRLQLLRAEREDAVRRELAVGAGPELRRS